MISYSYELSKITSIQFTFVVSIVALTMKSPAHSSCLTLHNGFFYVLFCILDYIQLTYNIQTYIQYCPLNVYLTNNEPSTTRHILYKIIIFKLLLIYVIYKLGV